LKAGAISDASGPNLTHSAAWADDDAVFEAACRRAGVLRVLNFDSLFEAAETLGRIKPFKGRRLAIVANGPGLGELKAEQLVRLDGELANFSEATQSQLGEFLPFGLAFTNPLNIQGDAKPDQLYQALKVILASKDVDAALVLHAPNAMSQPISSAEAVARATSEARRAASTQKPVIAVWYGSYAETNAIFEQAQIPHFTHGAIPGFVHVVRWNEAREFLTSTPPSLPESFKPDADAARRIVRSAMATTGRTEPARKLSTEDATRLLQAYAIPVVPTRVAKTPEEAAELSRLFLGMAGACVVKISSRDLRHRLTAIGGIAFDLKTPEAVAAAARAMLADVPTMAPRSHMDGVTVQPMVRRPNARELLAGLADHPSFGPIVVFGQGGKASKVARDRALALPPLDLSLARDLICRTHASRLFGGYEDVQGIDMDVLALTLVKIAQLAADLPEVRGLEIDPLLTDADGVLAMNATVVVAPTPARRRAQSNLRFAVAPYPKEQERRVTLADGARVFIRPVRPEDEGTYSEFASTVPPEDLRLRFFAPVKDFSHAFLARLTQIDYARAYAVAAFEEETGAMLGGVRLMLNADRTKGEFAILVGPQMKGRSLGSALMNEMIENARRFDLEEVEGLILSENEAMLGLCKTLGFRLASAANEPGVMHAVLSLRRPAEDACGLQDTGTPTSYG
jgi:acetyltransferase